MIRRRTLRRTFAALSFLLVLGNGALAQTCTVPNNLTNGSNADATQVMANFNAILTCLNNQAAPRGYLNGLTLSTSGGTSAFNVAIGVATSDDATTLMNLSLATGKTTGAWAVGSGNGALDSGSIANSTWYHVFEIARVDATPAVDILISQSATSPSLPTNYTKKRRIGSMKTDASAHWLAFLQISDSFYWQAPVQDVSALTVNSTPANLALPSVPTGINVRPIMNVTVAAGASNTTSRVRLYSPSILGGDINANRNVVLGLSASAGSVAEVAVNSEYTDTSAQLRYVNNANDANVTMDIFTLGWVDNRGR